MRSRPRIVAALCCAGLMSVACGGQTGTSGSSQLAAAGGTITERLMGDWATLNPAGYVDHNVENIDSALYDSLVALGPNGTVLPYLAKSWTVTPTSITFTVRTDAICSDGTRLTPTDIANSIRWFVAPETKFPQATSTFGPGPYSVVADDSAATVTFSLAAPHGDLLNAFLAVPPGYPLPVVCPAGIANPSMLTTGSAGTGPFTVASAVHGDSIVLKVRKDWKWGPEGATAESPGFPGTLVYKVVSNETTAANLLETGGLDLAIVGGSDVARLLADKALTHGVATSFSNQLLFFSGFPGHVTATDPAVRAALSLAIDGKAWNQAADFGYGTPGTSWIQPTVRCFDQGTVKLISTPSVANARQILLADGYTADSSGKLQKGGQPLTIKLIANAAYNSGGDYLAAVWNQVGVTVMFSKIDDDAVYNQHVFSGDWDAFAILYNAGVPDPNFGIAYWTGPTAAEGGVNVAGIRDATAESEIAQALQTTGANSCAHWIAAQEEYIGKHWIRPLAASQQLWFGSHVQWVSLPNQAFPWTLRRTV